VSTMFVTSSEKPDFLSRGVGQLRVAIRTTCIRGRGDCGGRVAGDLKAGDRCGQLGRGGFAPAGMTIPPAVPNLIEVRPLSSASPLAEGGFGQSDRARIPQLRCVMVGERSIFRMRRLDHVHMRLPNRAESTCGKRSMSGVANLVGSTPKGGERRLFQWWRGAGRTCDSNGGTKQILQLR
jgi:hypothetical protein